MMDNRVPPTAEASLKPREENPENRLKAIPGSPRARTRFDNSVVHEEALELKRSGNPPAVSHFRGAAMKFPTKPASPARQSRPRGSLDGPSRTITVEPLEQPVTAPPPKVDPEPQREPSRPSEPAPPVPTP
jgi:hypothetical protein